MSFGGHLTFNLQNIEYYAFQLWYISHLYHIILNSLVHFSIVSHEGSDNVYVLIKYVLNA